MSPERANHNITANSGAPHVVVVGAGFAGMAAVRGLARSGASVTLVDQNLATTFQPLLYQVATAGLAQSDISAPLRPFAKRWKAAFRHGKLAAIDQAGRVVTLADGGRLRYDYLVLAAGVSAAYFGVPGAAEHSHALYTRADAEELRGQLISELEWLSVVDDADGVSVVIIGGGATGVELAGTLAELRNIALHSAYPDVRPDRITVTLVEQGPALLAPFAPELRAYAFRQLAARGVDIRLGTTIKEVRPDSVLLGDGTEMPSDITVWAAGVAASDGVSALGLPAGRNGRILVAADLRVTGSEVIFAAGDVALHADNPAPQLAQPAIQQGRHVAAQIRSLMAGRAATGFRYRDKGIMATIGRRSAVVELPRLVRVRGTLAWLAWLALHVVTLLDNRNRIITLVNLSWRYLTWRRGGGVIATGESPEPAQHELASAASAAAGALTAGTGQQAHLEQPTGR